MDAPLSLSGQVGDSSGQIQLFKSCGKYVIQSLRYTWIQAILFCLMNYLLIQGQKLS